MASAIETMPPGTRLLSAARQRPASLFDRYAIRCLAYAVFFAILLGAKLAVINAFGNATPFWDQWDGEATSLYKPYLDGTLGWSNLLAPHNEHRVFTMRLLSLALLVLNGIWNPLLQMIVNAVLHVAVLIFAVALLARSVGRDHLPSLLSFSLLLFGIPVAWENTLGAFHACHYLVVLFSVACLWLTVVEAPLSARWWAGAAFAVLAFLSLASGICASAASAVLGLAFFATGLRKTRKQLLALAILAAITAVEAMLTPTLPHHAVLKAASLSQFFSAWMTVLGWPLSLGIFSTLVLNAPAVIFVAALLRERPPASDGRWFLLALVVWSLGLSVTLAYGRAAAVICPRYLDALAMGILLNFACLLSIVQAHLGKLHGGTMVVLSGWIISVLLSLGHYAVKHLPAELSDKRAYWLAEEINTRDYVATGDIWHLQGKGYLEVPHPDPVHLAAILAMPEIRSILPANIRASQPDDSIKAGRLDKIVHKLLAHWYYWIIIGLAAVVALFVQWGLTRRGSGPAAEPGRDNLRLAAILTQV